MAKEIIRDIPLWDHRPKFSEKTFKTPLKFFLGTVDIVSVRTKNLSARRARRISGGRGPILGGRAATDKQPTKQK